jgi:hypothetical protein
MSPRYWGEQPEAYPSVVLFKGNESHHSTADKSKKVLIYLTEIDALQELSPVERRQKQVLLF